MEIATLIHPIPDAAKLLHVSAALVRQEARRGNLKLTRIGKRKHFVAQAELEAYVRRNTR